MNEQEDNTLILKTASNLTNSGHSWKKHNPLLLECYNGIHPIMLSKLCHILFDCIHYNKLCFKKSDARYNIKEESRLYNSLCYSLPDILNKGNPIKYRFEEKDATTDISNLKKNLQQLENMNIFHIWKYKQPYSYMFIMEEDIAIWTYYNPCATLAPISLRKILFSAENMISTMIKFEEIKGRVVIHSDIRNSYGEFLDRLIGKMNPITSNKLSRWENGADLKNYIDILDEECKKLDKYDGVQVSEDFIKRIPENIAANLSKKIKVKKAEEVEKTEDEEDGKDGKDGKEKNNEEEKTGMNTLEASLVPLNGNLVRRKRAYKKSLAKKEIGLTATVSKIARIDPFKNSKNFVTFYRAGIRSFNPDAKFKHMATELHIAQEILDMIIEKGRDNDIQFLKGWIRYYASRHLAGNKACNSDNTTLNMFRDTFSIFNSNYVS